MIAGASRSFNRDRYFLQPRDPQVIVAVLSEAKKAGLLTVADTKLPNFHFLTLRDIREALPFMAYLTPNEDEARHFSGKDTPEEMADVFLSFGVRGVIIKLGGQGCYYRGAKQSFHLPALPVKAVDATGAGDNFVAGFTTELLRGSTPYEALRFANTCGASAPPPSVQ